MQFSVDLDTKEDCLPWFEWFKSRGIPAAIIQIRGRFFVFRGGKVIRVRTSFAKTPYRIPAPLTYIPQTFEIVMKCNGYTREGRNK
jgi:hypothetical protein